MQEDKDFLLKYLCMSLPYGVKVRNVKNGFDIYDFNHNVKEIKTLIEEYNIKPYLRLMSSIKRTELHEVQEILGKDVEICDGFIDIVDSSRKRFTFLELQAVFEWLLKNHFDFMGLIPKGLAIEVTESNNPYK